MRRCAGFMTAGMQSLILLIKGIIMLDFKRIGKSANVISSFKMDKAVIEEKLVPYLEKSGERYTVEADKIYTYVKIEV